MLWLELVPLVPRSATINKPTVQQLARVGNPPATRYLAELEKAGYLQKTGTTGVGTEYTLKGS